MLKTKLEWNWRSARLESRIYPNRTIQITFKEWASERTRKKTPQTKYKIDYTKDFWSICKTNICHCALANLISFSGVQCWRAEKCKFMQIAKGDQTMHMNALKHEKRKSLLTNNKNPHCIRNWNTWIPAKTRNFYFLFFFPHIFAVASCYSHVDVKAFSIATIHGINGIVKNDYAQSQTKLRCAGGIEDVVFQWNDTWKSCVLNVIYCNVKLQATSSPHCNGTIDKQVFYVSDVGLLVYLLLQCIFPISLSCSHAH